MRVYDASQLPVNPGLAGITKQYLIYMTETKLGIPPALLTPYTSGDATYLGTLGTQLNGYTKLITDIEYLPTSPATIVWYTDSAVYRAGAMTLLVDWDTKFQATYTGNRGFYGALPDFVDYARNVVEGTGSTAITAAYNAAYQYAVDAAPMVAVVDTLYPSFYLDTFGPGEVYEKTFADRMQMYTIAVNTTISVLRALYPGKAIEAFVRRTDLSQRLEYLRAQNVDAHVWAGDNEAAFTSAEIAVMQYWNNIDNVVTPPGTISMAKKISELDASLEALNPDAEIRIVGADGDQDTFIKFGTFADREQHTGTQTLATISDAGALAAKSEAALTDIETIAGGSVLANNSTSPGRPAALTAAQTRTLLNVANGATANSADATLLSRANHTGTQPLTSVTGLTDALGTIDAYSVTTDALVIDQSGTRYTVTAGADNTGPGSSGRALYIANVSGTPSYGVVGITSGNIDFSEGATSTVSVARTTGVSGAVTVTWTVSPGTHTTIDTGTISWNALEGGTKTFTLTAEQVASDITGGTVTISVTSGSATVASGFGSVTIATRNVVVQTPGVMSISATFPVGESGSTFDVLLDRSTGSDGAVAVDWTTTSGSHTTVLSGTETWIAGNSARHTLTLTRATVGTPTIGTITLSNARRTDGGSPAPTISGTQSATSFGINPSTNAGTISLVSTAIDEDENTPLPIVLTRSGGSYGQAVARWTITGVDVDTATGTITWADGEFGDKSETTLPVGGFVASDDTDGVLTVSIVSGSATLQAPITGTIAIRNVTEYTEYNYQTVIARYPEISPSNGSRLFTYVPPTTPSLGVSPDVAITTSNVGSYTGTSGAAANGKRLTFAAGTYGETRINGSDIEVVLQTGVTISHLIVQAGSSRIKISCTPARDCIIGYLGVGSYGGESNLAYDVTIDGITQTGYVATNATSNNFCVRRCLVLNSSFLSRNFTMYAPPGAAGNPQNILFGNCQLVNGGTSMAGTGTSAGPWRQMGAENVIAVDCRMKSDPEGTYQCHRIHTAGSYDSNNTYVSGCQFEGGGHAWQADTPRVITNVWYKNNLQYQSVQGPPININSETFKPRTMTVTSNRLYSGGTYPTSGDAPSGGTYTISGNTTSAVVTPSTWDFDKWTAFDPTLNEDPPHAYP
jgi:hypothetical protein